MEKLLLSVVEILPEGGINCLVLHSRCVIIFDPLTLFCFLFADFDMERTTQDLIGFLDWKIKTKNLKVNISQLEWREMKNMMVYYSIMQNACMQLAGLVAVSSIMAGFFRELKWFLVLGMILTCILYVVYPVYFGIKKMQGLKSSSCEVIAERKRLHKSCVSLMSDYNNMCDVASPFKNTQDLVFKEIGDVEMKKIKNFKKEDADLIYQTKYYQNLLLLIGIVGLIYAIAFISAFCLFFQDVPKVSRGVPTKLTESVVLPTFAAVKRLLFGHI